MNCVLQSLSNTRALLEYCVQEDYKEEINTSTSNMKGALIKGLLLKPLQQIFNFNVVLLCPNFIWILISFSRSNYERNIYKTNFICINCVFSFDQLKVESYVV